MDLRAISQRLDNKDKLKIRYKYPVQSDDGAIVWHERADSLLDVDVDKKMLYVAFQGNSVIWVKEDEVIEISDDDGVYG